MPARSLASPTGGWIAAAWRRDSYSCRWECASPNTAEALARTKRLRQAAERAERPVADTAVPGSEGEEAVPGEPASPGEAVSWAVGAPAARIHWEAVEETAFEDPDAPPARATKVAASSGQISSSSTAPQC
jgi:hypothetical protein